MDASDSAIYYSFFICFEIKNEIFYEGKNQSKNSAVVLFLFKLKFFIHLIFVEGEDFDENKFESKDV